MTPEQRAVLERLYLSMAIRSDGDGREMADALRAVLDEVELLRGAMAADDERLRNAERRVYGDMTWGCDAPDHMADTILDLRAALDDALNAPKEPR